MPGSTLCFPHPNLNVRPANLIYTLSGSFCICFISGALTEPDGLRFMYAMLRLFDTSNYTMHMYNRVVTVVALTQIKWLLSCRSRCRDVLSALLKSY